MTERHKVLTIRLNPDDWALIDSIAKKRGFSRAEAGRIAVMAGLRFIEAGQSVDILRVVHLIEYAQSAIDMIVHREHADAAPRLESIALERMAQYHAS